ncbi:MAG: molybdate ABC transporter substrate-binding protein [Acidobacteriota bacterium]
MRGYAPLRAVTAGLLPFLCMSCGMGQKGAILVFAASSVADTVEVLARDFTAQEGPAVVVSAGSSKFLQRQIESGAPADLFIAAGPQPVEELIGEGRASRASRRDLLSNRLVVVVPADSPLRLRRPADLLSPRVRLLAMGDPDTVPAGWYGRAALEHSGVWSRVASRLVPAPDVRAALAFVEAGRADAGIVYATDARVSRRVRVAFVFSPADHPPIVYAAVPLAGGRPGGSVFLEFLLSPRGSRRFREAGFEVLSRRDLHE